MNTDEATATIIAFTILAIIWIYTEKKERKTRNTIKEKK